MPAAMSGPTSDFWQANVKSNVTPWDRGEASPQLRQWLSSDVLTPCRIIVPGCGSRYEVALLAQSGFDVTGIDYAPAAIGRTRSALAATNAGGEVIEADVVTFTPDLLQVRIAPRRPRHFPRVVGGIRLHDRTYLREPATR